MDVCIEAAPAGATEDRDSAIRTTLSRHCGMKDLLCELDAQGKEELAVSLANLCRHWLGDAPADRINLLTLRVIATLDRLAEQHANTRNLEGLTQ